MIKTKLIVILFISCFLFLNQAFSAKYPTGPGTMRGSTSFIGEVTLASCSLSTKDSYQVISLGTLAVRDIQNSIYTQPEKFSFTLENCEGNADYKINENNYIEVSFEGIQGQDQESYASMGTAQGIEIQILDSNGYIVGNQKSLPLQLIQGNNQELEYYLRLVKTSPLVKAGTVYAVIQFKINYQ